MSDHVLNQVLAMCTSLVAGQERLTSGQERLELRLEAVEAGLARQASLTERLGTQLDIVRIDVMARMDRLQDAMASIREDIAVNYHAAGRAMQHGENTRDEIRSLADTVNQMHLQIATLKTQVRDLRGDP